MLSFSNELNCSQSLLVVQRIVTQLHRSYRPKRLTKDEQDKICQHTKPFIPGPDNPLTKDRVIRPHMKKSYERAAWARFGSSSQVNISSLLPSKDEILEEWDAEKLWWASLQEMKDHDTKAAKLQEKERHSYEKVVAENMAKMPKWIEQWEKEEKKRIETDVAREIKRESMTEKALEDFNYKHAADSKEVKDYVAELKEKERKEKRMMKRLAKMKV